MALKSTIFKAELQISDLDRHYYETHVLTIARHPSETDERMMVRLLAFALSAHHELSFGKGLSTEDEPALWHKDPTGAVELWIEVGQPDEKIIRKACGRAARVLVYGYGERVTEIWWDQNRGALERLDNLSVIRLPNTLELAGLAKRTMSLQCTIQEGVVWLMDDERRIEIEPVVLKLASR